SVDRLPSSAAFLRFLLAASLGPSAHSSPFAELFLRVLLGARPAARGTGFAEILHDIIGNTDSTHTLNCKPRPILWQWAWGSQVVSGPGLAVDCWPACRGDIVRPPPSSTGRQAGEPARLAANPFQASRRERWKICPTNPSGASILRDGKAKLNCSGLCP